MPNHLLPPEGGELPAAVAGGDDMPNQPMPYFPVFFDLRGRRVLLLGGGEAAVSKARLLIRAGARVEVVMQEPGSDMSALWRQQQLVWLARQFSPEQVNGATLVIDGGDDEALTASVRQACVAAGVPFNAVDRPSQCDFIVPAILDRAPVVVAVSTGGAAPALARTLRQRLEQAVPPSFGRLARLAARCREMVRQRLDSSRQRQEFWTRAFSSPLMEELMALEDEAAVARLQQLLDTPPAQDHAGSVTLVGAGPGDPGLLTLNAVRAIERADVILYDALVPAEILAFARRETRLVPVGKRAGQPSVSQNFTNRMLVALALQGQNVVRLKGGDPFIFGRGGEEAEILRQHGVSVRVVPGITAATGIAADLGIPLTHRGLARSLRLVTASCRTEDETREIDWGQMADSRTTLAIYMGYQQAAAIADALMAGGLSPATPAVMVENGCRPDSRHVFCTVAGLAGSIRHFSSGPVLVMIGDAVGLAPELVAGLDGGRQGGGETRVNGTVSGGGSSLRP